VPEVEAATIWLESEAAATVEGMPAMISRGVMRNPPPTPKRPERKPTTPPRPKRSKMLILLPAMGK
jgi:hypothetical protein